MTIRAWQFTPTGANSGGTNAGLAALIAGTKFVLGKPSGGGVVAANAAAVAQADVIKRGGNGSISHYYRPDDDPRWKVPAVQARLKSVVFAPALLIAARPTGYIIPFVEEWAGSTPVLELLADPSVRALYYSYAKGLGDDSVGGYLAKKVELEEPWAGLYESIQWPSLEEIWASIPVVSYERMIVEDYSFKFLGELGQDVGPQAATAAAS